MELEKKRQTEIVEPYKLPDGWKWIPLLKSFENKTSSNKKLPTKDYSDVGKYAIVDQGQEFIGGYSDKSDFVFDGELPIIVFGDHTKCIKYIDFPFIQGADGVKILKPISIVDSKYFYYALQNIHFPDLGYRRHFPIFKDYQIPLPPTLAEQQRIVNRIETMFAKLDQAQEKAQAVLDSFETRKAAILHKAFTGQLRIDNEELTIEDWEDTTIGKYIKLLSGQDFKPEDYNDKEKGIPYITGASNFAENHVLINRWTSKPSVIAKKDDVLLVCKGSGYGKTIIADFEEAHIARQIMALRTPENISNRFILYFLQNNYEYLRNGGQGLIPGIARNIVLQMPIKVPPLNYQLSIVNFLDTVLEKESRAKEAAQTVLDQIALLKKSILARAFRGEL